MKKLGSGDDGTTSTIDGRRVMKYDTEIKLYGYIDGAIACAGVLGWDDIQVHLHKTFGMIKEKKGIKKAKKEY